MSWYVIWCVKRYQNTTKKFNMISMTKMWDMFIIIKNMRNQFRHNSNRQNLILWILISMKRNVYKETNILINKSLNTYYSTKKKQFINLNNNNLHFYKKEIIFFIIWILFDVMKFCWRRAEHSPIFNFWYRDFYGIFLNHTYFKPYGMLYSLHSQTKLNHKWDKIWENEMNTKK